MTNKEQIERITKLLNELALEDTTLREFDAEFPRQSINVLKDKLWRLYCFVEDVCDTINMGDTEPKTGHWVKLSIFNCNTDFKCSECGYIHNFVHPFGKPTAHYTYCPNCGAKMKSEE